MSMADRDKTNGSDATDADAVRPMPARPGLQRRFANLGGAVERTIFQPKPRRPAMLRPGGAPPLDSGDTVAPQAAAAPRRASEEAAELSVTHNNPLMEAAGPLLLLLGRLRTSLARAPLASLTPQIIQSIGKAEAEMLAAGVNAATAERAKYCLCMAADEVLGNLPDSDTRPVDGIVQHFFSDRVKGTGFLDSINTGMSEERDLLELQHACLALVFVGNSRTANADAAALQRTRRDLFERLQSSGPPVQKSLSPHWQGLALPAARVRLQIPFWAITGIVGMLLFALYLTLRGLLGFQADQLGQTMRTLTPAVAFADRHDLGDGPAPLPATPTQASQLERIRKTLAEPIGAGNLAVVSTANQIIIRIPARVIFPPERASVFNDFVPTALHVALALDQEPGPIKVIGHTDDKPLTGSRYASNFQLSLEQAKAVAALIRRSVAQPDRVVADGKGSDVPLASNDTADGRDKNRRIEIVIPRGD
jgi:type VI secretion system protein ImpK